MPSGARAPRTFLPNQPPAHPTQLTPTPHSLRFTRGTRFLRFLPCVCAGSSKPKPYKTEMCPHFLVGTCPFGKSCTFAHDQSELRPITRHEKYKTKMCRNFTAHGYCNYGIRCNFSHVLMVPSELKCVPAAPPSPHTPGKENKTAAPFARSPADFPPLRS